MAKLPTYEQMAKDVAEIALDEYMIEGKTLREWIKVIAEQEPCDDCISRKDTIDWLKQVTVTDGITFEAGFKQILHDIEQMPSIKQEPKPDIKALGEELRSVRDSIKGDQTLVGYNIALGICNKYLSDSGEQEPRTDYKAFVEWVASEIFSEDWEFNKDSFAEVACRKLSKLGIATSEGDAWKLKESEE